MSASPTSIVAAPSAAASPSSSTLDSQRSSQRYTTPPGYDPLSQPNPCAHIPAAAILPLHFPEPRKPVRYEDGWEYYRRIGSPKTVCAPMVAQSELAFRLLCRRYNTQLAVTPMFHAGLFGSDPNYRRDAMQVPKDLQTDKPLVVQFCGHDPQVLLKAARLVQGQCDAVDLNLGCPQNIAKRGFYGSFLLTHTQLLHDIVSTLHQYLDIPITCKIRRLPASKTRTGDEETIALVKMLQEAGAAMITVHGRSRLQLKDKVGQCDFDLIRLVKQNVSIPVFANGGIHDWSDVETCLRYTGVDGVMSSEALLCNPSLFAGKREDSMKMAREYMKIVEQLREEGTETDGSTIRGHLFKMLYRHLTVHKDLRDRMGACPPEEFYSILDELDTRFSGLSPSDLQAQLDSVPVWYWRHIQTPTQLAELEKRKGEREQEEKKREQEEEEGLDAACCMFGEEC
jgi:tRNA-dihydrouridine synthase 1